MKINKINILETITDNEIKDILLTYEKNNLRLEELLYYYQKNEAIIYDLENNKYYNKRLELINLNGIKFSWFKLEWLDYDSWRNNRVDLNNITLVYWDVIINLNIDKILFSNKYILKVEKKWWYWDVDIECPDSAILFNTDKQFNVIRNWVLDMSKWWNSVCNFSRRTWGARDNSRFKYWSETSFCFEEELKNFVKRKWVFNFNYVDKYINDKYLY